MAAKRIAFDQEARESILRGELPLGLLARADAGSGCAAATGKRRQCIECGTGAAEVIDQITEGARTDIVAADEPQPVDPLVVGECDALGQVLPPG